MGMNYYWQEIPCPKCHHASQIHIGKSSAGWVFGWHGYRRDEFDRLDTEVERLADGPLDTVERWVTFLHYARPLGLIVDEEGEPHSVEEFLMHVASKRGGRSRLAPGAIESSYRLRNPDMDVHDPAGDDLTFCDFS